MYKNGYKTSFIAEVVTCNIGSVYWYGKNMYKPYKKPGKYYQYIMHYVDFISDYIERNEYEIDDNKINVDLNGFDCVVEEISKPKPIGYKGSPCVYSYQEFISEAEKVYRAKIKAKMEQWDF